MATVRSTLNLVGVLAGVAVLGGTGCPGPSDGAKSSPRASNSGGGQHVPPDDPAGRHYPWIVPGKKPGTYRIDVKAATAGRSVYSRRRQGQVVLLGPKDRARGGLGWAKLTHYAVSANEMESHGILGRDRKLVVLVSDEMNPSDGIPEVFFIAKTVLGPDGRASIRGGFAIVDRDWKRKYGECTKVAWGRPDRPDSWRVEAFRFDGGDHGLYVHELGPGFTGWVLETKGPVLYRVVLGTTTLEDLRAGRVDRLVGVIYTA